MLIATFKQKKYKMDGFKFDTKETNRVNNKNIKIKIIKNYKKVMVIIHDKYKRIITYDK